VAKGGWGSTIAPACTVAVQLSKDIESWMGKSLPCSLLNLSNLKTFHSLCQPLRTHVQKSPSSARMDQSKFL
jgi:hypothetical protein